MTSQRRVLYLATLAVVIGAAAFFGSRPLNVRAAEVPEQISLFGVVRDFRKTHPDFDIAAVDSTGHTAMQMGRTLAASGDPMVATQGLSVTSQWYDKNGNAIAPYFGDPGLPGGHFDVDVYSDASSDREYHKHEFDDSYDVDFIDIAGDPNLLFDALIGASYPNDLRVEFLNPGNGQGNFEFEAGATRITGPNQDGLNVTFSPGSLSTLHVSFVSLFGLRATSPGDVKDDIPLRDGSFAVRMFDVPTGALVYEVTVYHHGDGIPPEPEDIGGDDVCGEKIEDTPGEFGVPSNGNIKDAASFDDWFTTRPGTNLARGHDVTLTRDPFGVYDFYPVDTGLYGTEAEDHNNNFTYEVNATFTYHACTGQFFEFEGNDDAWVYIDGKLVMDLGGVSNGQRQYVALDRLGLVDGNEYPLDFFYAQRRAAVNSTFRMRTNLQLGTDPQVAVSAGYD